MPLHIEPLSSPPQLPARWRPGRDRRPAPGGAVAPGPEDGIGRLAGGIATTSTTCSPSSRGYAELAARSTATRGNSGRGLTPRPDRTPQRGRRPHRGSCSHSAASRSSSPQLIDLNEIVEGMASRCCTRMHRRGCSARRLRSTPSSARRWPTRPSSSRSCSTSRSTPATRCRTAEGSAIANAAAWSFEEDDELPHPDLVPGSVRHAPVRDTGRGMDYETPSRSSSRSSRRKDVGEGTGLGLATVHGIVSQSGGAIWMSSTLGEGTCFTVCLPVAGDAR